MFARKIIGVSTLNGSGGPNQEVLPDAEWSRADNDIQMRRWFGTPEYIDDVGVALQNSTAGFEGSESYSLSNLDDGRQAIISSHPSDNALAQWELVGEELSSALKNHPRFSAIKDYELLRIEDRASRPRSFAEDSAAIIAFFDDQGPPIRYPDPPYTTPILKNIKDEALIFYNLRSRGVAEYLESSYTLRVRFIVIAETQLRTSYTGINQLFTTAELKADLTSQYVTFPASLAFSIDLLQLENPAANIPAGAEDDVENYVPKWLKGRPTQVSQGGGRNGLRFELSQTYRLYNWHRRLYIPLTGKHPLDPNPPWLPVVVP